MYKWTITVLALTMVACSTGTQSEDVDSTDATTQEVQDAGSNVFGTYGEEISIDEAISPVELMLEMEGRDSMAVTLEAVINSSCKKKGCWMNVDAGNGEEMKVTFTDYGFFVPKEGVEGMTAIMQGTAMWDTLSVEMLRHYAEDGGATPEEIEEITEPEFSLSFVADGVVIRKEEE